MLSHYWNSHTRLTSSHPLCLTNTPMTLILMNCFSLTHTDEMLPYSQNVHTWNALTHDSNALTQQDHSNVCLLACTNETLSHILKRFAATETLSHMTFLLLTAQLSHFHIRLKYTELFFFSLANKTLSEPTQLTHTTGMLSYTPLKGSHTTELFFSTHTQQKHSSETRTVLDFFLFRWQTVKTFASHKHVIYFFAHTRHENNKKTRLKHAHVSELRESISAAWWDLPASP